MLRRIRSSLFTLPRLVLLDVWQVLIRLLQWLIAVLLRLIRRLGGKPSTFDRKKRLPYRDCVPMTHPAFRVPDPLIYSQPYLMELGLAVTWDNPDILLKKNGIIVSSYGLEPDTEYDIEARIWNNSLNAPIVDLPVSFSYLAFGIGTETHPITPVNQPILVTLGVKGSPNHPAFATAKWQTPAEPGHYCIQVNLHPVSDANYGNNMGQENTQVGHAQSPAAFTFLLRNKTTQQDTVHFEVDTYTIPELPLCGRSGTAQFNPRTHATAVYPVPPGWLVTINPSKPILQPHEEKVITVNITPPQNFKGTKAFNVNAFGTSNFLGGVTLYVQVD